MLSSNRQPGCASSARARRLAAAPRVPEQALPPSGLLSDRLKEAESGGGPRPTMYSTGRTAATSSDALGDYKERVHQALFTRLGGRLVASER